MFEHINIAGGVALVCAVLAALIILWYVFKQPPFTLLTQGLLFVGLGALPIGSALTGNVAGFEATKSVHFCSSCHVMLGHSGDAQDPHSQSLAARHSRNNLFGHDSCYTCHADYGLFGSVFTKINGMHHMYEYLTEYRSYTLDEALPLLEMYKPFPNANCMQCHSTTNRGWLDIRDHAGALEQVRSGEVSCASAGCHGYAHPFTKAAREKARAQKQEAEAAVGEAP